MDVLALFMILAVGGPLIGLAYSTVKHYQKQ